MKIEQTLSHACFRMVPRNLEVMSLTLFLVLSASAPMAFAMNWEGHDDWLTEEAHAQALRSTLPKATPIAKAFPLCAERAALHAHNPYEQRPISGINCIDPKDETGQPAQ
jgi:hypothetical protein